MTTVGLLRPEGHAEDDYRRIETLLDSDIRVASVAYPGGPDGIRSDSPPGGGAAARGRRSGGMGVHRGVVRTGLGGGARAGPRTGPGGRGAASAAHGRLVLTAVGGPGCVDGSDVASSAIPLGTAGVGAGGRFPFGGGGPTGLAVARPAASFAIAS